MYQSRSRILPLVLAGLAFSGCESGPAAPVESVAAAGPDAVAALSHGGSHGVSHGAEVQQWLAGLRATLTRYKRLEAARNALWPDEITSCMELPGTGGMGFHYGDLDRFDTVVDEFAPELLVYEPQKNGRMELVAVEYAVPLNQWTEADPPNLHGVEFHVNPAFGLWVLHAWVGEHNPAGIFMDWNPRVSCQYAPVSTD